MTTVDRANAAGLACLTGGVLWFLALVRIPGENSPPALVILFALANLCLLGGPLGLLALLGQLSNIVGMGYILARPAEEPVQNFTPLGAVLIGLGMLVLGGAVLRAGVLHGWRRVAPLLVGTFYVVMMPIQVAFFFDSIGGPSYALLACWGATWVPVGLAIRSSVSEELAAEPALDR